MQRREPWGAEAPYCHCKEGEGRRVNEQEGPPGEPPEAGEREAAHAEPASPQFLFIYAKLFDKASEGAPKPRREAEIMPTAANAPVRADRARGSNSALFQLVF